MSNGKPGFRVLPGRTIGKDVTVNKLALATITFVLTAFLTAARASDFYAYYTRLDYDIPLKLAMDYIPRELDEESKEILRRLEALEEEEEEEEEDEGEALREEIEALRTEMKELQQEIRETEGRQKQELKEDMKALREEIQELREELRELIQEQEQESASSRPITGRYADVVVNLGPGRQLVFSRESSYLPFWKTDRGKWSVKEIVPRQKDIACLYSYVRIIENRPDRVLVHWRYMPDLRNVGFATAVHEYFEIAPDGKVIRKIRKATEKLDDWNDPENVTVHTLQLTPKGIKQISLKPAKLSRRAGQPVARSPVKADVIGSPAAWWRFDEGLLRRPYERKDLTKESVNGYDCAVDGNATLWKKGISGTALAFDGYHSKVTLPASETPAIKDELTVDAWVALGAYPWNWAPVVHQSIVDPGPIEKGNYDERGKREGRTAGRGYYLGVGPYGYPLLTVDGKELKGSIKLSTNRWTHVVGTYGNGRMRIFVDGQECGSKRASGRIDVPNTALLIGLNNQKGRATDPVRGPICHLPVIYGIEGLIDEVKIYNAALTRSQVKESYDNSRPDRTLRDHPDLQPRVLPGQTGLAKKFGAYHTRLKYHDLWDNLWRPGEYADLVVKFDQLPTSVVYWRGANSAAGWVTENNKWMEDQSCETGGPHGCSEHMADKQCRHAHVRVIENTDARVVLHWRYASIDVAYLFPSVRHWADEYHTIYPDGCGVRKVYFHRGNPGWQDIQFFSQPGTTALDNVHRQALALANLKGDVRRLTWTGTNGVPRNTLRDACIEMVNFRSKYKVYLIFQQGTHINPWGHREQSAYTDDPFAGPWNHWPVSQVPSDGRFAVAADRVTHAAIAAADNVVEHGNMAIYGFANKDISTLVPLARSWNNPPTITDTTGCSSEGYDKAQRAYVLTAKSPTLSFTLNGSANSPIVNPCFVIKNWPSSEAKAGLKLNSVTRPEDKDFRQGIVRDTDGTPTVVIWIKHHATAPVRFEISRK